MFLLGFFVDVDLFKVNEERAADLTKDSNSLLKSINGNLETDVLADEDANLMIKLKFLTYKVWLIC